MNFCSHCSHPVELGIPVGDSQPRYVCSGCGLIHYTSPKIIVSCIAEAADGRILICRRGIEPRIGFWTLPGGYLEMGEGAAQGAARETLEEAQAEVQIDALVAVFDAPAAGQVSMLYRGRMKHPHHGTTCESLETRLVSEDEMPWDDVAFITVTHGLKFFFADRARGVREVHEMHIFPPYW